jgi:hypothetical protein
LLEELDSRHKICNDVSSQKTYAEDEENNEQLAVFKYWIVAQLFELLTT